MATETERDEGVRRVYKDYNLHVLWGVTLMAVLGTSSVTPAFPTIVRELGISSGQVGLLRFFQGMGPAALGTLNVTVIGDIYDGRERSSALGYNSSVLSVGTASYPAIGGLLATFGWFYPFALPFAPARR